MLFKVLKDFHNGGKVAQRGSIIELENSVKVQTLVKTRFLLQAEPDAVATPEPEVIQPKPSTKKKAE